MYIEYHSIGYAEFPDTFVYSKKFWQTSHNPLGVLFDYVLFHSS